VKQMPNGLVSDVSQWHSVPQCESESQSFINMLGSALTAPRRPSVAKNQNINRIMVQTKCHHGQREETLRRHFTMPAPLVHVVIALLL
jgi:hypothetical protein